MNQVAGADAFSAEVQGYITLVKYAALVALMFVFVLGGGLITMGKTSSGIPLLVGATLLFAVAWVFLSGGCGPAIPAGAAR